MLALDLLPLVALAALLASGRAGPLLACAGALLAAVPVAVATAGVGPGLAALWMLAVAQGLWLALAPVGIVLGGLVFHGAVRDAAPGTSRRPAGQSAFGAAFLLGPFAESVTGFGVGMVFAIGALRDAGLAGAWAASIGLFSQCIIEWGGLGPGTAIGAALAEVPGQAIAQRNAWQCAAWMLCLLPLFWRLCAGAGVRLGAREKAGQAGWVAAAGACLIAATHALPWELGGLLATGPLLCAWLLREARPAGTRAWAATSLRAAPYALLVAVLLGARLWTEAPRLRPFPNFPAIGLDHPLVALWAVGGAAAAARGRLAASLRGAWARGARPAAAILMYVVLARVLFLSDVPQALAAAMEGALGAAAPYASPLIAAASGVIAGTNVGSNSTAMTLQAALGRAHGLDPSLLPGVQNFVGASLILLAPQIGAIACGLAGGAEAGATVAAVWRRLWPVAPIALAIGLASVAIGMAR